MRSKTKFCKFLARSKWFLQNMNPEYQWYFDNGEFKYFPSDKCKVWNKRGDKNKLINFTSEDALLISLLKTDSQTLYKSKEFVRVLYKRYNEIMKELET